MSEQELENKTIYIYQYNGYNGRLAQHRKFLWRCTLIGVNGKKMFGGNWMSENTGYENKQYAEHDAKCWSDFLGWPIVDLGRAAGFDDALRD